MVIGRKTPTIAKPMASSTSVITVNVRSENTANGSSGSASWVRNCRHRNRPSSTTPTAITNGNRDEPDDGAPVVPLALDQPEHHPEQPGGQQADADEVEPVPDDRAARPA